MSSTPPLRFDETAVLVVLVLLLGLTATAQSDLPILLPGGEFVHQLQERTQGESGVAIFPIERSADGRPERILNPAGYRVWMTPADEWGDPVDFPAGEAILPPPGRQRVVVEGRWMISPYSDLMIFASQQAQRGVTIFTSGMEPAGRVSVSRQKWQEDGLELRLLAAGDASFQGVPRVELTRRRALGKVAPGVLMPVGPAVAALWDPAAQRYVALSGPFVVPARETVLAPLEAPEPDLAHLIAYVDRPADTTAAEVSGLELTATQDGEEHAPDLTVLTDWGAYAFWYALAPGPVTLAGANDRLYLEPATLGLEGGRITRHDQTMERQILLDP